MQGYPSVALCPYDFAVQQKQHALPGINSAWCPVRAFVAGVVNRDAGMPKRLTDPVWQRASRPHFFKARAEQGQCCAVAAYLFISRNAVRSGQEQPHAARFTSHRGREPIRRAASTPPVHTSWALFWQLARPIPRARFGRVICYGECYIGGRSRTDATMSDEDIRGNRGAEIYARVPFIYPFIYPLFIVMMDSQNFGF